ncbi:parvulin-like peptidyl-prolyl isomerase [Litorimonas taeanensis]|uniref:Parvulin-like peptidyl-prolyl isomerase n=1 Tax=Litorimonas taeanensis TaxID=568099 RepID=A0A420WKR9_9PROT|nr:peptidylprolyl isomerase [Litorimonas taeanensis]RKQ71613.1 parvulin-like peptidyl-prolyl isomerase [Litorimonas taeanensis]
MAESIGGKIRNALVGILIGMLVLAFAVWGVNDMFSPGAQNAVATVGKKEITTTAFDSQFSRELQRLNQEQGQGLTNQQAYDRGLHNQILQGMITNQVIAIDAEDLGVGVNRSIARREIESIPAFQNDLTGKFDENQLLSALSRARITRQEFEADTLQSLRSRQTVPAITGGLVAPSEFAALQYKFLTEQRRASVLTLEASAIATPETPSDTELQSYIDANSARYMAPEYRKFVMIRLEPFDFTPDLKIDPVQVKENFDYKVETGVMGSPETRNIVLITAIDEEMANKAVDALKAGAEATLVANEFGIGTPEIYDAVRKNGIIDAESSEAAFALEEGDARAVLSGLGSWVAVYAAGVTPAVVPNFEDAKADIENELMEAHALEAIYDISAEIEDAMVDGMTLEEISEKLSIPLSAYDFIDRSGSTPYNVSMDGFSLIPGVASDDEILRTLFTSDLGYQTDLFETSNGGYATIRVDDIIDSKMREFDDIKDAATLAYLNERRADALRELALSLTKRAKDGESLAEIAAEFDMGATISEVGLVRTNPPQSLGPQVTVGLFDAKEAEVVRGAGPAPLTEQIAILDRIIASQDGLAGTYLEVIQSQMTAAISNDIQSAYQAAVLEANPVVPYPEKIRTTLGLNQAE